MKYSVCTSAVYHSLPLPEAMRRIASLGYEAYEFWGWWTLDLDAVDAVRRDTGLHTAAFCTRMVPLNDRSRHSEYLAGLRQSIAVAHRLDCRMLISQVGQTLPDLSRAEQHDAIVEGLRLCAPVLEDEGITLVIEPLNDLVDHRGYYLTRSREAFDIVREAGSKNIQVLFDVYHQQITEGNLIRNLSDGADRIGHIHIAGVPGRHEPLDSCEVCYSAVLNALQRAGYNGFAGLEYIPLRPPEHGLAEILRDMPL